MPGNLATRYGSSSAARTGRGSCSPRGNEGPEARILCGSVVIQKVSYGIELILYGPSGKHIRPVERNAMSHDMNCSHTSANEAITSYRFRRGSALK
jgi:hypothetical protein